MLREYNGHEVELNDESFLLDTEQWTPEVAAGIAAEVGLSALSDQHWKVISFCREDAVEQGTPPGLRRISKLSGVGTKDLYKLFPKGPGKLAARISGLPKPKGCV